MYTAQHLNDRVRRLPWAATILQDLRHTVRTAVARGVTIPAADDLSGWAHNFTCGRCAERHTFAVESPGPFICIHCGHSDNSQDHREAWIYCLNLHQITTAVSACIIVSCDDDLAALAYARDTLLGYGQRYRQ